MTNKQENDNIWPLEKFVEMFPNYRVKILSGQVAVDPNHELTTDLFICAQHRRTLVPDLATTLTPSNPELVRRCPIKNCPTRAQVGPAGHYPPDMKFKIRHYKHDEGKFNSRYYSK